MVLRLAEHLDVPLRERNAMLLAAGFAPEYSEQNLEAPDMAAVRAALDLVLDAHHPYPAVAVDRYWNIVAANPAATVLSEGVAERLLTPEPNVYRISLHPEGMASRIRNFAEYAPHLLAQLRHDLATTADPQLGELLEEVESYSTTKRLTRPRTPQRPVVVPLRFGHPQGELSLFTTIATFGTPADVTVSELAIESFFPADSETASLLQQIAVHQTVNATTAETRAATGLQPGA
jgi:hypothetical protein